jgi:hypothetical protein
MRTLELAVCLTGAILTLGATSVGCVADRPSRNGVFNENQYVRKDFLIQGVDPNGNAVGTDPGWLVRATVTETATPNLIGNDPYNISAGTQSDVSLVRFRVTQDKLDLLAMNQLSNPVNPQGQPNTTGVTEAVINAWPVTNVDLKYQVNLDGEKTNFYSENQELDWQVRQWVKLQFDKNDFSDLAPLGATTNSMIGNCADLSNATATLVTNSFSVQENDPSTIADDYMEFTIQVAFPMKMDDANCKTSYGSVLLDANLIGRNTATVNLKYSFMRATPTAKLTYQPFILPEKDKIRTKYGPIQETVFNRDPITGLLAANQYIGRYDPLKPIVWYFDQGFPAAYKDFFLNPTNGIKQATNKLLAAANTASKAAGGPGVTATVDFQDYDAGGITRSFGDVRYNFLRWVSDQDTGVSWDGATWPGYDPRTGELVNQSITVQEFDVQDMFVQRIDAFLVSIGASSGLGNAWPTGSCTTGDSQPIVNATLVGNHNAASTLFQKMQNYLGYPATPALGPQDFTVAQNTDFLNAYYQTLPYEIYSDPDENLFVTQEGGQGVYGPASMWQAVQAESQFQQITASIDTGAAPYAAVDGTTGVTNAAAFENQMRTLTQNHSQLKNQSRFVQHNARFDDLSAFSFERMMQHDAQRCINGQWETQASWTQGLIDSFWRGTLWHEFGHAMGLEHNFMGSIDQNNFPAPYKDSQGNLQYSMYSSSVMDYPAWPNDVFITTQWGPYDAAAITWIYANNSTQPVNANEAAKVPANTRSGQADATYPYLDPNGWCAAGDTSCCAPGDTTGCVTDAATKPTERQFLRCDDSMQKYSPVCRQFDSGTTPSQIMANAIDDYEWQYPWRNFRSYHKVWDESQYAGGVSNTIADMNRFLAMWAFDWAPGNLVSMFQRIGLTAPAGSAPSQQDYFTQLTNGFSDEMSTAASLNAAFDEAVLEQTAGERPYATDFDNFYGDETQQGIILDKQFAMQGFVGIWEVNNYNPNDRGAYESSWASFDFTAPGQTSVSSQYQSIAETAVDAMIGGQVQYAAYPYFIPAAVALFAQDTHSAPFLEMAPADARVEDKDWIGGVVFTREQDLIDYFRRLAVTAGGPPASTGLPACTTFESCTYDVTNPAQVPQSPQDGHFTGPDGLIYVYAYVQSRNVYVLARQDRNIVTYFNLIALNTDLIGSADDGTAGAYSLEYAVKYTIDAYEAYEQAGAASGGDDDDDGN